MKPILKGLTACALSLLVNQAMATDFSIYGLGHVSLDYVDAGITSSVYTASISSRLGFKGRHALESNLTVIFQFETGVDLTAQGGNDGNGGAQSSGQIFTKGRPVFCRPARRLWQASDWPHAVFRSVGQ